MMNKELTELFIHIIENRYVKTISSKMSLTKVDINNDCYIITYIGDEDDKEIRRMLENTREAIRPALQKTP